MKAFFIALLFAPLLSSAQKVEISLGGGLVSHDHIPEGVPVEQLKNKQGYTGQLSASVKGPWKLRFGIAVSSYRLHHSQIVSHSVPRYVYRSEYRIYIDPVSCEITAKIRNKLGRFNLDMGIAGGTCIHKRERRISLLGYGLTNTNEYFKSAWYTYGITTALSYTCSPAWAVGVEASPKYLSAQFQTSRERIFLLPVTLMATFRI